jgi:hypothetical protein
MNGTYCGWTHVLSSQKRAAIVNGFHGLPKAEGLEWERIAVMREQTIQEMSNENATLRAELNKKTTEAGSLIFPLLPNISLMILLAHMPSRCNCASKRPIPTFVVTAKHLQIDRRRGPGPTTRTPANEPRPPIPSEGVSR